MELWKSFSLILFLGLVAPAKETESNLSPSEMVPELNPSNGREWINKIVPANYNQLELPVGREGNFTVNCTINPWAIGQISLERMEIEIDLYLLLRWEDDRLNVPEYLTQSPVNLEASAHKVWVPPVRFRNCKGCETITYKHGLHTIELKGKRLKFPTRHNLKFRCNYDLTSYPMDVHRCSIEVESTYLRRLQLQEYKSYRGLMSYTSPPDFDIVAYHIGECPDTYFSSIFSCMEFAFIFKRKLANHMMLTYTPSCLIVVLSWLSFWLDVSVAAPRVALGLTTLLTLATQFSNVQFNMPPVSYVKAIDIWMFSCMFMVGASLIEFAIANFLSRQRIAKPRAPKTEPMTEVQVQVQTRASAVVDMKPTKADPPPKCVGLTIDKSARIVFPIVFLCFNIGYWQYFAVVMYNDSMKRLL